MITRISDRLAGDPTLAKALLVLVAIAALAIGATGHMVALVWMVLTTGGALCATVATRSI